MRHFLVPLLLTSFLFIGCGGSSGDDAPDNLSPGNPAPVNPVTENPVVPEDDYEPETTGISQLTLVDGVGQPLSEISVEITPADETQTGMGLNKLAGAAYFTDINGEINVSELTPGSYLVGIEKNGVTAVITFVIDGANGSVSSTLALPVILESNGSLVLVGSDGFVAAFNGIVYSELGPIEGAQVEISAGATSNGAIASAQTNENGEYVLILNVGSALIPALSNTSLRIISEGFQPILLTNRDISGVQAVSGGNHLMVAGSLSGEVVYQESFETLSADAACGDWTTTSLNISGDESNDINLWHSHDAGLNIINQALIANLVQLAPDDSSNGSVPDPLSPTACWYGQAESGSVGQGNFLGEPEDNGNGNPGGYELDGGTSESEHAGAIVSPVIDLSAESAPLALTFRSWWEIEAVNPNENGFDLLSVEYREEDSSQWVTLARLNPLSDPVGVEDLEPLPYTNRGFNRAPAWLWQEPIPLDDLAGKRVQLRLAFYTVDHLYNGFRGWLVDDLRITRDLGTFPLWQGDEFPGGNDSLDLTLSNVNPDPDEASLTAGIEHTISLDVDYLGAEEDIRIVLHYNDNFSEQDAPPIAQLEQGQTTGQFNVTITPEDQGIALLIVQVLGPDDELLATEWLMYPVE